MPPWFAIDAMLLQFANTKVASRYAFSKFVEAGKGISPWDNISNQVFLGDDDFVQTNLNLL
ncbi:hypothetical protein [Psychromonas aquatilis]|uniref:Uncharacterized protein n=1 Tax=Psychromonas aquatilis TaxID=2005072 RepID=A0ABU9GTB1_9GAMM